MNVFVNGCFDLLHIGHVRFLRRAAEFGPLHVAVDSDERVARLKGPHRPVVPLAERVEMLRSLRFVDFVWTFDTETALERLLFRLSPLTLVKGEDYRGAAVFGAEYVVALGGDVRIIESDPVRTTDLLRRINHARDD